MRVSLSTGRRPQGVSQVGRQKGVGVKTRRKRGLVHGRPGQGTVKRAPVGGTLGLCSLAAMASIYGLASSVTTEERVGLDDLPSISTRTAVARRGVLVTPAERLTFSTVAIGRRIVAISSCLGRVISDGVGFCRRDVSDFSSVLATPLNGKHILEVTVIGQSRARSVMEVSAFPACA